MPQPPLFQESNPDGWFHLYGFGDHPAMCGNKRVIQRLDRDASLSLVNDLKARCRDRSFPGVLVDFDHDSEDLNKPTRAAGWVYNAEVRSDGVWALSKWTSAGRMAIENGEYRLVSPVFDGHETDDGFFVPDTIRSIALCNSPNIKGSVPISNRCKLSVVFNWDLARSISERAQQIHNDLRIGLPSAFLMAARQCSELESRPEKPLTNRDPKWAKAVENKAANLQKTVPNLSWKTALLMAQRSE